MKRLVLFISFAFAFLAVEAQFQSLELEKFYTDDGTISGYPAGNTTWRLYVVMENDTTFLSSVWGDANHPLLISTTTSFWQSSFGANTGDGIIYSFFPLAPSVEYDSFVTIGRAHDQDSEGAIQDIGPSIDKWMDRFAAGGDIDIKTSFGGTWFITKPDTCGWSGADNKVLIGQFTTDGDLSGYVNLQVFQGLGQTGDYRIHDLTFSSLDGAIFGCTDSTANNYNPDATVDDGSCIYDCNLGVATLVMIEPSCASKVDGSIEVTASGTQSGNPQYALNNGAFTASGKFTQLANGSHVIRIKENACTFDTTVVLDKKPVTVSIQVSNNILCFGQTNGKFVGTGSGGTGTIYYGLTDIIEEQTKTEILYENLAKGNYTVYAHDENNCKGTSNTISIIEPALLQVNFNVNNATNLSCAGDNSGRIFFAGKGGVIGTGYQHSLGGVDYRASGDFTGLAAGAYQMYVKDANGCISAPISHTLTEPAANGLNLSYTANNCFGESNGVVSAVASGADAPFQYSFNNGTYGPTASWTGLEAGNYPVKAKNSKGCVVTKDAVLVDPEKVGYNVLIDQLCSVSDENGSMTFGGTGGDGSYVYNFDNSGFNANNIYSGLSAGVYTITVQDGNGCLSDEGSEEITGSTPPSVTDATMGANAGEGCEASAVVSDGSGTISVDWWADGSLVASGNPVSGLEPGNYTVIVTDECDATDEWSGALICEVGIEEYLDLSSFQITPNPTTGLFRMNLVNKGGEKINYNVTDAQGRLVVSRTLNAGNGNISEEIDLSHVADGMYYLQVNTAGFATSVKIVKNN